MELPKVLVDSLQLPPLVQLLKGLYGTHDAPKVWYDLLLNVLIQDMSFIQSTSDPCLFFHSTKQITIGVYVDDVPLTADPINYR